MFKLLDLEAATSGYRKTLTIYSPTNPVLDLGYQSFHHPGFSSQGLAKRSTQGISFEVSRCGQVLFSRDLSILSVTTEVGRNHIRRRDFLAHSTLDKSLQERLPTLPDSQRTCSRTVLAWLQLLLVLCHAFSSSSRISLVAKRMNSLRTGNILQL